MASTTPEQEGRRPVSMAWPNSEKRLELRSIAARRGSEISVSLSLDYPGNCANPEGHFRFQRSGVLS